MIDLPEPKNWNDRTATIMLGLCLFGISAAVGAYWTVDRFLRNDCLTASITLGGAVFACCFALMAARAEFHQVELRANVDPTGTVLRPDPVAVWLIIIACVAAIPSGLLYVIFVPRGRVDLPLSRGEQIFSPILVGLLVVFAAGAVIAYVVRGPGHLKLTPHGFEVVELITTRRGDWSDLSEITDHAPGKSAHQPIVLVFKQKTVIIQNASGYVPGGAALYWMVRHYWLHPEDRLELTDERAIERLRTDDFTVE